jgi:Arc/MetJ family transcription regulator
MGRMTVTLDDTLLDHAQRALGARTKREAITIALEEALRRRKMEEILSHRGQVALDMSRDELLELRGRP